MWSERAGCLWHDRCTALLVVKQKAQPRVPHVESLPPVLSSEARLWKPTWRPDELLVVALAALVGSLAVAHLPAALAGLGGALVLLGRRLGWPTVGVALLAAGLALVAARREVEGYEASWESTRSRLGPPRRCWMRGTVDSSPTVRNGTLIFTSRPEQLDCDGVQVSLDGKLRLYGGPHYLARGDRVEGVVQIGILRLFRNLELPRPAWGLARSGVVASGSLLAAEVTARGSGLAHWIDGARAHVRQRIEATFSKQSVGMAKALVLGENDLTEVESKAFKESGLAHLLAVSGTHLVFAVVALVSGLQALLVRLPAVVTRFSVHRWVGLAGAVGALFYADFAGGSGSAWRAAWMLAAAYLVQAMNREVRPGRIVAASILAGILSDPLVGFDISFMLSLAATCGLLTLGRWWSVFGRLVAKGPIRKFLLGLVATAAAVVPCSFLLAQLSSSISVSGAVINVLVAPFGEVIALPLCLAHTLLAWAPAAEQGTALVGSGALMVVKQAALWSAWLSREVPWLSLPLIRPGAWHTCIIGLTLCALVRNQVSKPCSLGTSRLQSADEEQSQLDAPGGLGQASSSSVWAPSPGTLRGRWWARLGIATTGLLPLLLWEAHVRSTERPRALRVTLLDVGQGDGALVDLPDGSLMLVDGGGFVGSPVDPGARVIVPVLRARRRERIDVMVLSHPHPDHFKGLLSVVEQVEVGEFWDTGQGQVEGAGPDYAALMHALRQRHIPILGPQQLCGKRRLGGLQLNVLGPCPGFVPGRDANDNSWILHLRHGRRSVLFTGDAEREQEQLLLEHPEALRADLLKVGHHGSRTSTQPEFLHAVQPQVATLSCGVRNRYGHPHPVTLNTLSSAGVATLRLDYTGAVQWQTDGNEWRLITAQGGELVSRRFAGARGVVLADGRYGLPKP